MADKSMNSFPTVTNSKYVYVESADGSQGKIILNKIMENSGFFKFYGVIESGESVVLPYISGIIIVQNASSTHGRACAILNSNNSGVILAPFVDITFFSDMEDNICIFNTGDNTNYIVKNNKAERRTVSIIFIG